MLQETDSPIEDRLLPILCLVPRELLPTRDSIYKLTTGKQNINERLINDYLDWTQSNNEIIAYTGYGYYDADVPKTYDYLLDLENPEHGQRVKAKIKFGIWSNWMPLDTIERGHKTICIIEFDSTVPNELLMLPNLDNWIANKNSSLRFGLCDRKDKDLVIDRIKNGG